MKNTLLKKVLITLPLLISVMYVGVASAHDINEALGESAAATDMYQLTCFDDGGGGGASEHLYLEIRGNSNVGGLKVSAQLFKDGMAFNTTDATSGDQVYSPGITFKGGDGSYILTVDKSAAGAAGYAIVYHCESSTGNHTGTIPSPLQNQ
jgi:hypothetical protein